MLVGDTACHDVHQEGDIWSGPEAEVRYRKDNGCAAVDVGLGVGKLKQGGGYVENARADQIWADGPAVDCRQV